MNWLKDVQAETALNINETMTFRDRIPELDLMVKIQATETIKDNSQPTNTVGLNIRKSRVQPKLNRENTTEIQAETDHRITTGRLSKETKPGINLLNDAQYLNNVRYQLRNDQPNGLNNLKGVLPQERDQVQFPEKADQTAR